MPTKKLVITNISPTEHFSGGDPRYNDCLVWLVYTVCSSKDLPLALSLPLSLFTSPLAPHFCLLLVSSLRLSSLYLPVLHLSIYLLIYPTFSFVCLSVYPCNLYERAWMCVRACVCFSTSLSISLFHYICCLSICLFYSLSINLPICIYAYLYYASLVIYLSIHPSIYLSLFFYPSIYLYTTPVLRWGVLY